MRGGSQRAFCQSWCPSFEGQQNAAPGEDASLRLIADCRLSICEVLPHCGGSRMCFSRVRNGALTHRDVKNEDRTGYVYENTGDDDKLSGQRTGFYTKMHSWREDQQESVGFLGRECISYTIRQDGRRQTVDGKRGETVGTRCGCQGPGQGLSGEWREATNIVNTLGGFPRCTRNKRSSSFRINMSESIISFK
jgi:hypothetical protein